MPHGLSRWGGYQLRENGLWLSDVTTGDVSTTKHGFAPKAPNDATKYLDGTGAWTVPAGTGGGADHAFYTYLAAALEPLAIEAIQLDTFSYAINSSTSKILLGSWNTRLGSGGRFEKRDPTQLLVLRDVTMTGLASGAFAQFLDPSAPTYADARTTYLDRLNTLATSGLKYLALSAPSTFYPLLPGPYGIIVVGTTTYDFTWITVRYNQSVGIAVTDEIGDTGSTQAQRVTNNAPFPLTVASCCGFLTGQELSAGVGKGGVLYYICTSAWGAVADGNTYSFRDDFMGASLDTGTDWTRAQSTAGNVEIDTTFAWCKVKGNSSWGTNGAYSQTTVARAAGKVFECYVYTGDGSGAGGAAGAPNVVVGWSDAGGQSYTNFAHGIDFSENVTLKLFVFENGTSRGEVGASYSLKSIYRVRITLGASSATYEIQGGTEYAAIGGASWTDITPGTSSSTTTPLAAGFTIEQPTTTSYVGDVKTY